MERGTAWGIEKQSGQYTLLGLFEKLFLLERALLNCQQFNVSPRSDQFGLDTGLFVNVCFSWFCKNRVWGDLSVTQPPAKTLFFYLAGCFTY